MKALRVSLLVLLLSAIALATPTFQCNQPVNDLAGVLGSKTAQVSQAASNLNSKGADTRIATVDLSGYVNMDAWAAAAVKNCPSMQSSGGSVKTTLVIIAVAPASHKMGIYAGKAFELAFGADRMLRYKTQFMGPHFKAQEWAEGLIAAANQMADRLAAYTSEVNTPVTNTTVNEASKPTDYHGLWIFFWIIGGIAFIVIAFVIAAAVKKSREEAEGSQQSAIAARNRVTYLLGDLASALSQYAGVLPDNPGAAMANSILDEVSQQFSSMATQLSCDPTQAGLGVGTYDSLTRQYSGMAIRLTVAKSYLDKPDQAPSTPAPTGGNDDHPASSTPSSTHGRHHSHHSHHSDVPSNTPPVPLTGSRDGFVDGLIVEDMLSRPSYREPDRSYRDPEPEPEKKRDPDFSSSSGSSDFSSDTSAAEPERKSSFSDDSGSSDFGASDSSSSSFSSSSSDSSFSSDSGSSSSDFGGGSSSSDF